MYNRMTTCGCPDESANTETVMICAGAACTADETFLCAEAGQSSTLPKTIIEEQVYVYGFSPSEALERGTMFPELVN